MSFFSADRLLASLDSVRCDTGSDPMAYTSSRYCSCAECNLWDKAYYALIGDPKENVLSEVPL